MCMGIDFIGFFSRMYSGKSGLDDDMDIVVEQTETNNASLSFRGLECRCSIGKGKITENKVEGDLCTPAGKWPLRRVFYREDRLEQPRTSLQTIRVSKNMGWSDDPRDDRRYNTLIKTPYPFSHEALWRSDSLYDIIVELGYNDSPPILGRGSAIFMHLARANFEPTAGCIALKKSDLLSLLSLVSHGDLLNIVK